LATEVNPKRLFVATLSRVAARDAAGRRPSAAYTAGTAIIDSADKIEAGRSQVQIVGEVRNQLHRRAGLVTLRIVVEVAGRQVERRAGRDDSTARIGIRPYRLGQ
jgi:hypothetical protein